MNTKLGVSPPPSFLSLGVSTAAPSKVEGKLCYNGLMMPLIEKREREEDEEEEEKEEKEE